MSDFKSYPIAAMGKPRMTRGDSITMAKMRGRRRLNERERKREAVLSRWLAYSDEVKYRRVELALDRYYHLMFILPMPPSWSKRKRAEMLHRKHQQVPDKDNLEKGLLDILHGQDCGAWDGRVTKVWGVDPFIVISPFDLSVNPHGVELIIEAST